jgi:hypothetical protein
LLVDQTAAVSSSSAERADSVPSGSASGRFVRISIIASGQPAALAEVEMLGMPKAQP